MVKRKTIGESPLDLPASEPAHRYSLSALPSKDPSSGQADLLTRIQALEEQSSLMKWLVYGAIGLAIVL